MNQAQLERLVGITDERIAAHIAARQTCKARFAYDLLCIQAKGYDPGGFALLKDAVKECRQEMGGEVPHAD